MSLDVRDKNKERRGRRDRSPFIITETLKLINLNTYT